jgi:uncharacterized DUF497 family protein
MFTKCLHSAVFEWDEGKRLKNQGRHGLDFLDVDLIFDGRPIVTAPSLRNNEHRFVSTEENNGKLYSVVWTWRGTEPADYFLQEGRQCRSESIP